MVIEYKSFHHCKITLIIVFHNAGDNYLFLIIILIILILMMTMAFLQTKYSTISTNIDLFIVSIETIEKGVKYAQS